jgi:hypothetical protein
MCKGQRFERGLLERRQIQCLAARVERTSLAKLGKSALIFFELLYAVIQRGTP